MDTKRVTPASASSTPAATQVIPTEDKQNILSLKKMNVASAPKWGWQDALYLLTLVLLVGALAYNSTPNFTSEVAGMWWDPLLNMWTLSWDTTTLLHAPTHLWQASLLYPNNLTLSYSENLLGEVIFFAPFFLVTHNPVLSYNVTFYLTFLLCGTNMYIVARHYTGKPLAAFVAALIYAFAPYRIGQIDHIHIVAGEWMPLAFLYLDLSLQKSRWRHWSLLALFYLLQLLSSIYYGIFLSYTLLAYILIRYGRPFLAQLREGKEHYFKSLLKRAVKPLVVFSIMLIILGILLTPYLASLNSGLARSLSQTASFSAFVRDFAFTTPFNRLYGIPSYNGVPLNNDSEHYLFLGWTTMALAALGTVLAFRTGNRQTVGGRDKSSPYTFLSTPTMRALLWTALIVLLFAFGPALQFSAPHGAPLVGGPSPSAGQPSPQPYPPNLPMPWLIAYYLLPGFKGLRVPARLVGVLLVMLALLAAYAVAWLQEASRKIVQQRRSIPLLDDRKKMNRIPRFASSHWGVLSLQCLLVLASIAIVMESMPVNVPVTHVPTGAQIPAVYRWLATHGEQQPIVELPISHADGRDEAWYDYYAIYHPHPIVNGWSGYRPPLTIQIAASLQDFPSSTSLTTLRQYHIHYVVLHLQSYSPDVATTLLVQVEASPELYRVAVFGSDSVWQVK